MCTTHSHTAPCTFPRPWVVHRMPKRRCSLFVIFSTCVQDGGGLPFTVEPGLRRCICFCGSSTRPMCYATIHAITPPFWALKRVGSGVVVGCRWKLIGVLVYKLFAVDTMAWGAASAMRRVNEQESWVILKPLIQV